MNFLTIRKLRTVQKNYQGGNKIMNNLQVIEHNGMRVLTTGQLAESYGATTKKISNNFKNNERRYQEGKHFICLTGDELNVFKTSNPKIEDYMYKVSKLYLWTEKDAWRHAKSLNTDEACGLT